MRFPGMYFESAGRHIRHSGFHCCRAPSRCEKKPLAGDGRVPPPKGRIDPHSRLIQPVTVIKGVQSRPRKSSLVPSPPHLPRPINPSRTRRNESIRFESEPQRLSGWSLQSIRRILFRNKHLGTPFCHRASLQPVRTLFAIGFCPFPTLHFLLR